MAAVGIEGGEHPGLRSALQTPGGLGLLKRLCASRAEAGADLVRAADGVLQRLPAAGIPLAQLAIAALGDAHALDVCSPVGTLVLAALRERAADQDEAICDESRRDLWAAAGVLVNELARPALVLNLPGAGRRRAGRTGLSLAAQPAALATTLGRRGAPGLRLREHQPAGDRRRPTGIALCAVVCTEGMPAAAKKRPLVRPRHEEVIKEDAVALVARSLL